MDDSIAFIIFFVIAVIGNIFAAIKKSKKKNNLKLKNVFANVKQNKNKYEYNSNSDNVIDAKTERVNDIPYKKQNSKKSKPPKFNVKENYELKNSSRPKKKLQKSVARKTKEKSRKLNSLKDAVIWSEILQKPVSMR